MQEDIRRSVLFLVNGFGVDKKDIYDICNDAIIPNINKLARENIYTAIDNGSTNYSEGYRIFSTSEKGLPGYKIVNHDILDNFDRNEKFNNFAKKLVEKNKKLHIFSYLDNDTTISKEASNRQRHRTVHESGVVVEGADNLMIRLSKCCNPIPGDEIIGFVSQGQGIKVHRKDCPNVNNSQAKPRLIEVYWDYPSIEAKRFEVDLIVRGSDRVNLLTDVITVLGSLKINILNLQANVEDAIATLSFKITVDSSDHLKTAKANIMKVVGVYEIERVIH